MIFSVHTQEHVSAPPNAPQTREMSHKLPNCPGIIRGDGSPREEEIVPKGSEFSWDHPGGWVAQTSFQLVRRDYPPLPCLNTKPSRIRGRSQGQGSCPPIRPCAGNGVLRSVGQGGFSFSLSWEGRCRLVPNGHSLALVSESGSMGLWGFPVSGVRHLHSVPVTTFGRACTDFLKGT